jgi:hypothetical protein
VKAFLTEWSHRRIWPRDILLDNSIGKTEDLCVMRQRIAGMSLEEFAQAGLIVTVDSAALREHVIFASDNASVAEQIDGLTAYRAAELTQLADITLEQLQKIHVLKKTFRASIEFVSRQ